MRGSQSGESTQPGETSSESMRTKWQELLAAKRELVLPLHMKQLMQAGSMIDDSLSFLL
jgi:hypothetical protein